MLSVLEKGSRAMTDQQLPCFASRDTSQDGNARAILVFIVLLKGYYESVVG